MAFDLGGMFKSGSIAEQFVIWQVLAQFAQPIMAPAMQGIANEVWQVDPNVPLPADLLAGMVNRNLISEADALTEASRTGVGETQFRRMVKAAGTGATLTEVLELWRRGLVPLGSPGDTGATFYGAMQDAGVRDEWIPLLADLKVNKPTGEAALNALLQGQIPRERALKLWLEAGEDPDWFQDAFNSQGTAPTPDMLGTMANRGIIPWDGQGPDVVSFQQGFLEGPWRNKWLAPMHGLMQYQIPPRSVTAMVRTGAITDARALQLFQHYGLSTEDAAAMLADAHHQTATTDKSLAKTEITALYKAHKITSAQATKLLEDLKYSAANAALIISLADVAKADTHVTAAMSRVHTLYTSHKITRDAAAAALEALHIAADQRTELLALWDLEIGLNVRALTPAEIMNAWKYEVLTQAEAATELHHLGYTPFDAWVLMSTHNKKPLPGKPTQGPTVGVNP